MFLTSYKEPAQNFNDLIDQFFNPANLADRKWSPRTDIAESENAYELNIELAGLNKEDVKISFEDSVLTVSGERKFENEEETKNAYRRERFYGEFKRSFQIPKMVNSDKIEANFKNGVLTVSIPKAEEVKAKEIEISVN